MPTLNVCIEIYMNNFFYSYIYIFIYYLLQINLPVVFKPANFIQKGGKNCFGMCNIYNEETVFYS